MRCPKCGRLKSSQNKYGIDTNDPPPLKEIARRWIEEGEKPYQRRTQYPLQDIYPYREWNRTRVNATQGVVRIGGESYGLRGDLKWDALADQMASGWPDDYPAVVSIGQGGKMIVDEGNHRLGVAKQLGLRWVPVRLKFKRSLRHGHDWDSPGPGSARRVPASHNWDDRERMYQPFDLESALEEMERWREEMDL